MAVMVFGYTVSQEDEKVVLLKEIIAQAKNVSDHLVRNLQKYMWLVFLFVCFINNWRVYLILSLQTQTDNVSVYKQTEDDGSTCVVCWKSFLIIVIIEHMKCLS